MLEPRQILEADFLKTGVRRRARAEAEEFMEQCADTVSRLMDENAQVREKNAALCEEREHMSRLIAESDEERGRLVDKCAQLAGELDEYRSRESQISEAMVGARRTADEMVAKAREQVALLDAERGRIIDKAKAEAEELKASAREFFDRKTLEGQRLYEDTLARAKSEAERVETESLARKSRVEAEITRARIEFADRAASETEAWKETDAALVELKRKLAAVAESIPAAIAEGLGEKARRLWESVQKAGEEERRDDKTNE